MYAAPQPVEVQFTYCMRSAMRRSVGMSPPRGLALQSDKSGRDGDSRDGQLRFDAGPSFAMLLIASRIAAGTATVSFL
jgi:hypothetical protein